MSLTKDKEQAKNAMTTLRDVEKQLDVETRQRYRQALDAIGRYNGELRRDRSTIVALVDAATRPVETVREIQQAKEITRLEAENEQLRRQVELERHRPIVWSDVVLREGLQHFRQDHQMLSLVAQNAMIGAMMAYMIQAGTDAPEPTEDDFTNWGRRFMELVLQMIVEYDPELDGVVQITDNGVPVATGIQEITDEESDEVEAE